MGKLPSPCIDVCKYKLKGGHCIGCGMTKAQKKTWKRLDGRKARLRFLSGLVARQAALGGKFRGWHLAYRRKCARKDAPCPLDDLADA